LSAFHSLSLWRSSASVASPIAEVSHGQPVSRSGVHRLAVTVNAITPGYVATEMVESIPEKVLNRIKGSIPMGRLAQPWEVARVVHFLAADASGYITGQVWGVNGGLDM
jgi:NAD(P)-dependent dehydrogenase (short-subunit alcohol dehydrogenase family)